MSIETRSPTQKIYYDPLSVARRTRQVVYGVEEHDKKVMLETILHDHPSQQVVLLTKSKRRANELGKYLEKQSITPTIIHGNHRAEDKEAGSKAFNTGASQLLITTDMILQSLRLETVDLLIHYDLPLEPKHYFDRLGFLKEKGASLACVSSSEEGLLGIIEYLMKMDIAKAELEGFEHSFLEPSEEIKPPKAKRKKPRHKSQRAKKTPPSKEK
jgi:superfamily II DNA/RNA helicase